LNRNDSALLFYERAIASFDQARYIPSKLRSMTQKADLLFNTDRLTEALLLYREGLQASGGFHPATRARCLNGIAKIYLRQERYDKAIQLAESALTITDFEKFAISQLNQMYQTLYNGYKGIGNDSQALKYLELVAQTQDSLFQQEKRQEIARLTYEREVIKEMARNELEQNSDSSDSDRSSMVSSLIILVSISLVGLLAILIRSYIKNKKSNELLTWQAVELKKKNNQLALLHEKEQSLLKDNLEEKDRRMVAITMTDHEKLGVLKKIDERLQVLTKKNGAVDWAELKGIRNLVRANLDIDSSWDSFVHQFDQVNPTFFSKLRDRYPEITINDLKTCAYIKIGMDNKGIAQVTNSSPNTIKSRIHRLKKKMDLGPDDSIRDILIAID